jgi:23S rRNA (uracil1939-C5)-methyltransferase
LLLTIDKLTYGGDGLARLPADEHGRGKVVFTPFVLPGEQIEATVVEQKPGFLRARLDSILTPSGQRAAPACPYFQRCGGCHYQHASYEAQLEAKAAILRENLLRLARIELSTPVITHPSPPWNYRNRTRFQVRTQPHFGAGFFRFNSNTLLPVETCPISSPLINRALAALWDLGRQSPPPATVHEIEFFANADDIQLLAELSCSPDSDAAPLHAFALNLRAATPELLGVIAATTLPTAQPRILLSEGESALTYTASGHSYRVTTTSFFQVNRHLIGELVHAVTHGASGDLAFDLYAGVGLFSTVLARQFRHIQAVEASQSSCADLRYNLAANERTATVVNATVEQFLARDGGRLKPDFVVVDPPRSGLGERVAAGVSKLGAARVAYVSCDPSTLARDLKPLFAAGYRIAAAHLLDLFPQTFHLETVLQLER